MVVAMATVGAAAWYLRPQAPNVTLSPHKTKIEYITFADAHRKPLIKFGSFRWPRGLEEASERDDPEITMGYLVMDIPSNVLLRLRSATDKAEINTAGVIRREIVPIQYPPSREELECKLVVGEERITIKREFNPQALPARLKPAKAETDDYDVSVSFLTGNLDAVEVSIAVKTKKLNRYYSFATMDSSMSWPGTYSEEMNPVVMRGSDGTIKVDLEVQVGGSYENPGPKKVIPFELKQRQGSINGAAWRR